MCSQPGNNRDLAAYSGHPSSYMIGSEAEPDSNHRHDFGHPPSQPLDMGLRYMTVSASDDVRFGPHSGNTHSPVYLESSAPSSASSSLSFSPLVNAFPPSLSGSYSSGSSAYYSSASSTYSMSDLKPRLGSIGSLSSGMAPPSQSPALPHLPRANARDIYSSATPQLRRGSELMARSPPTAGGLRGMPISPPGSGFATPAGMDSQLAGAQQQSPPLNPTVVLCQFQTTEGHPVRPEVNGKIDKGFFRADGDWTCYRRNYFSLQCSFTLHPFIPPQAQLLMIQNSEPPSAPIPIYGFAMSIAAVADSVEGKTIDLVQHTAKRDKGPQNKPNRISLSPRQPNYGGGVGDSGLGFGQQSMYDQRMSQASGQPPSEATFERIQFKQATANNGKRRAAQQYYHLLVELFADTGAHVHPESSRWIKVAYRMSEQMVVRGRSPGHYQSEKREGTSSGPSGQGGGSGSYGPGGGVRPGDQLSMSGASSILSGNNYGGTYDNRGHQYSAGNNINNYELPVEPIMSSEEAKAIDEIEGYQYYPSVLHEGHLPNRPSAIQSNYRDDRHSEVPAARSAGDYSSSNAEPRIKQELSSGFSLPSLTTGPIDTFNRHCGRFEGTPTSRGYYPMVYHHSEVDTS